MYFVDGIHTNDVEAVARLLRYHRDLNREVLVFQRRSKDGTWTDLDHRAWLRANDLNLRYHASQQRASIESKMTHET